MVSQKLLVPAVIPTCFDALLGCPQPLFFTSLSPSWVRFSARFLDLASSAGRLLDPFCSFSPFLPGLAFVWLPHLGSFHTSGLRGVGTRAPRVLPPPTGTFRLLETRHYLPQTDGSAVCIYAY